MDDMNSTVRLFQYNNNNNNNILALMPILKIPTFYIIYIQVK